MTLDYRTALSVAAAAWSLTACAVFTSPDEPKAPTLPPLNTTCRLAAVHGGTQMNCQLTDQLPDTQVDTSHPGSVACSKTSFSVFKQSMNAPVWLTYGDQRDDGPLRVRVDGTVGPGTHVGSVGKSAGNDCDATLGPVQRLQTRFEGHYTALVDKTQRPACVFQSSLGFGKFTQTLSAPLEEDIGGLARESTSDALQKRLDLEVAAQVNQHLHPSERPLSDAAVSRNGRCPDGFRSFSGR